MSNSVSAILWRALRLIKLDEPHAYTAIANRLEGMTLNLDFDSSLSLQVRHGEIVQSPFSQDSQISVVGDRSVVLDLAYGRISFTKAVYSGKLEIAGAIGPLTCALSAVDYFVAALLRIDSAHELLIALEASG